MNGVNKIHILAGKCAGGDWELFVLMGEVSGSGLPLGWLFVRPKRKNPPLHAKRDVLIEWFKYFREECDIWPHFTLSDKDLSEINALRSVWPNADYQLCYWHVLRALRKRLAIRKRAPAPYSIVQARSRFEFIDQWFMPIGQRHGLSNIDVSIRLSSRYMDRLLRTYYCSVSVQIK